MRHALICDIDKGYRGSCSCGKLYKGIQYSEIKKEHKTHMKGVEEKRLADTQKLILSGRDKSRCCKEVVKLSRYYPFNVYCTMCGKQMVFEKDIIFIRK